MNAAFWSYPTFKKYKHDWNLCGGFELKIVMNNSIAKTRCQVCMNEFNKIRDRWSAGVK